MVVAGTVAYPRCTTHGGQNAGRVGYVKGVDLLVNHHAFLIKKVHSASLQIPTVFHSAEPFSPQSLY